MNIRRETNGNEKNDVRYDKMKLSRTRK